jgi:dolichol-phosphate mannosyltransferase
VKLSIIIPVYNESATITQVVERVLEVSLDGTLGGVEKEIVIVNDGSTDETGQVLDALAARWPNQLKIVHHERNRGKGAAIRTALDHATGDLVITQDADLEYDPQDYPALLAPFKDPAAQVVYGSRNLHANPRSTWSFYWGGRLLSGIANFLYGSHITDEATGYKVFRTDLLRDLDLQSTRFEFCPEATAKILRRGIEIHETPISYQPRSFVEGKKINWRDGLEAIWTLLKYRLQRAPEKRG